MGHILVTGSSRGIGKAALVALGARGVQVIGHASRPVAGPTSEVPMIAADFGDPLAAQGLWELALDVAGGEIDVVVNNAGRFEANRLDRSDLEWLDAWEDTLRVNLTSAAQLSLPLTGHASRGTGGAPGVGASNVDLLAGDASLDELIADIEDGILVDYLIGQGVNMVTGDYSRGAAGRRIVKGRVEGPVAGFTIAGNLLDMFASLRAANDLETWRPVNAPSLRVDGMTVAGG